MVQLFWMSTTLCLLGLVGGSPENATEPAALDGTPPADLSPENATEPAALDGTPPADLSPENATEPAALDGTPPADLSPENATEPAALDGTPPADLSPENATEPAALDGTPPADLSPENATEPAALDGTPPADLSPENATEPAALDGTPPADLSPDPDAKNESALTCKGALIVPPEYYELLPNRSVFFAKSKGLVRFEFYVIINGSVHFCRKAVEYSEPVAAHEPVTVGNEVAHIGIAISMVSLLLHLIVFCLVPDLRNLPGWNLASLCACLFVSYSMRMAIDSDRVSIYTDACAALAYATYFFFLASFLWMSIISSDVFVSLLRATGSFRSSGGHFRRRKFALYCLCAFGTSLSFGTFVVLSDTLDFLPEEYTPHVREKCWFSRRNSLLVFFVGPTLLLSCLNLVLFAASAFIIHKHKRKCDQDARQPASTRRYLMYLRLFVIMGATWATGLAANLVNQPWMWFVFVVLNTLQGLFIFLCFTFSKKVTKYFRQKFLGARRSSEQSLTPTFQSYCVYSNSVEDDKTAESTK